MASTSASIMLRKQVSAIPSLTRLLHQTSSQNYQINYEQLRAGKDAGAANVGQKSDLMRDLPKTVTSNVKSIQGKRPIKSNLKYLNNKYLQCSQKGWQRLREFVLSETQLCSAESRNLYSPNR